MNRVWLHNAETDGYFHCPEDALGYWLGMGWEESDPPEEENLAVAERRAWEKQQADAAEAAKPKKTVKPAASGDNQES